MIDPSGSKKNHDGEESHKHTDGAVAGLPSVPLDLLPCQGLILAHNNRQQYFRERDYHRWAAYCGRVCQCPKMDLLAWGRIPQGLLSTIAYVREFDGAVSLRTDGTAPPDGLEAAVQEGLGDVFLCPPDVTDPLFQQWLTACSHLKVPVRLQLQVPRMDPAVAERFVSVWPEAGVRMVTVVLEDPFQSVPACQTPEVGQQVLEFCNLLAELLPSSGVELHLVGLPPRLLNSSAAPYAVTAREYRYSHHNYDRQAFLFAQRFFSVSPMAARSMLLLALKRHTVSLNVTDRWLTEKLYIHSTSLHNAYMYAAKRWRARRGTRLARTIHDPAGDVILSSDRGFPGDDEQERALGLLRLEGRVLPDAPEAAVPVEILQPKYYDRFDEEKLRQAALWRELAREARSLERTVAPSRVCDEKEWATYEAFVIPEYGATAWLTSLSGKKVSTQIDMMNLPFMVSVTVGGGIAEVAGFQLTPSCKILCPMVETRHTLTLYVRGDGRYVLLRDGVPMDPVPIPGEYPAPRRAPCVVRLRFIAWDIEERVSFSPLRLWKQPAPEPVPAAKPEFSVVIFCTRFARRLSAVLQCLAHQADFDLSKLEVVVGYVPGLDATEDVLETLRLTHPELRVVHATFPYQNIRSKGYVLNQCMDMASGSRILLLDADTILPPTLFAELERYCPEHPFVFPKGRAMLGPEVTARILQGDLRPWEDWNGLLASADEIRENEALGVPIGYFQCFNRECLKTLRYPEYEHFQSADYEFALGLRACYGEEYRLAFPVAHLDHAGSQWLGAERHF